MTWQQILKAITPQNVDSFYEELEDIFGIEDESKTNLAKEDAV